MKGNKRFQLQREKRIKEFAHTLQDYLTPLGITEGLRVEDCLQKAIRSATESGLTLAQQQCCQMPRRNGCRPGDNFDPCLMTAEGIDEGSDEESQLVEAGGRIAMILSPPFAHAAPSDCYNPIGDMEAAIGQRLSNMLIQKGKVLCYTMKEGKDGGKSVEIVGN